MYNWAPAHDFVTTFDPGEQNSIGNGTGLRSKTKIVPRPDRIFACVGKGAKGGITEIRHGYEANIGLEVDYDATIMHAWALSPGSDLEAQGGPYTFLLSLGDRSGVLKMSADAVEIEDLEYTDTKLDLNNRTVLAVTSGDFIVQVTEKSIIFTNGTRE